MLFSKIALLVFLILLSCVASFGQEAVAKPTPVSGVEIYLAKDDGTGKAGDEATSFVTTDVPIYCVVLLESALPTTVMMNLVAVAVPGVKADTKVVSSSYTTKDDQDRVNFTGKPAGQWVAGRYRVDIFVGGVPVISREFAVQKAVQVPAKPIAKPVTPKATDRTRIAGRMTRS